MVRPPHLSSHPSFLPSPPEKKGKKKEKGNRPTRPRPTNARPTHTRPPHLPHSPSLPISSLFPLQFFSPTPPSSSAAAVAVLAVGGRSQSHREILHSSLLSAQLLIASVHRRAWRRRRKRVRKQHQFLTAYVNCTSARSSLSLVYDAFACVARGGRTTVCPTYVGAGGRTGPRVGVQVQVDFGRPVRLYHGGSAGRRERHRLARRQAGVLGATEVRRRVVRRVETSGGFCSGAQASGSCPTPSSGSANQ